MNFKTIYGFAFVITFLNCLLPSTAKAEHSTAPRTQSFSLFRAEKCPSVPSCLPRTLDEAKKRQLAGGLAMAGIVSQLDSPMPGPADAIAFGILLGTGGLLLAKEIQGMIHYQPIQLPSFRWNIAPRLWFADISGMSLVYFLSKMKGQEGEDIEGAGDGADTGTAKPLTPEHEKALKEDLEALANDRLKIIENAKKLGISIEAYDRLIKALEESSGAGDRDPYSWDP